VCFLVVMRLPDEMSCLFVALMRFLDEITWFLLPNLVTRFAYEISWFLAVVICPLRN
jgi:hypothetical protein